MKATEIVAAGLLIAAALVVFLPPRHPIANPYAGLHEENTEKFRRQIKEEWSRIPAALVQMIRPNEDKKKI